MPPPRRFRLPPALLGLLVSALRLAADDGMWLLNQPPAADLQARYGFTPSAAWLGHLQRAAVRFNNGGSGSFASADGLIVTNHHVAADALHKLSTHERDLLKQGWLARAPADELPCVDLELNVLQSIEDVTDRVNAGVRPDLPPAEALAARNAAKAALESESLAATGLRSDLVTLYQGARYHLYRYKRYTDVRLVWAPEEQAAFFGGDPDNFEYPRYNLDVTLFRAYENGRPAQVEHHLKWQPAGTTEGDLVFLVGHPGSTQRLITLAELEYARDTQIPNALRWLKSREVLLNGFAKRSPENARRAQDELRGIENSRKVWDGRIAGLLDPAVLAAKRAEEDALRRFAQDRPELGAADAWERIAAAQQEIARLAPASAFLESYQFNSELFSIARRLVRAAAERPKADGDRLAEYRAARRASFELALFSAKPIHDDFEELKLTHFLTLMAMELGARHPAVVAALDGQPPAARAAALVAGTRLKDVAVRRALHAQEAAELAASTDPMIRLALALDEPARALRRTLEQQAEIKEQAHARLARVRYAKDGDRTSPDATFTLRLAYGTVKGLATPGGAVPAYTRMDGMFTRAAERDHTPPYQLPASWLAARARLAGATPFNFISTNYSIGGNSGSPVVNRAGEFVGILFDGNLHTLGWNYAYTETLARSVSVDVRAILEALRVIYGADALAAELTRP